MKFTTTELIKQARRASKDHTVRTWMSNSTQDEIERMRDSESAPQWLVNLCEYELKQRVTNSDAYSKWLAEIILNFREFNMNMDEWQNVFPYDYVSAYASGMNSKDATIAANTHYWNKQGMGPR